MQPYLLFLLIDSLEPQKDDRVANPVSSAKSYFDYPMPEAQEID
jgi:hypothetical protein